MTRAALATLLSLALGCHLAYAGETAPTSYSLAVGIAFGSTTGPERLCERVTDSVVALLQASPCFSAVEPARAGEPRDLLLRVTLDDFEDAVHHEASIGETVAPNANPVDMASRVVATVSALARVELRLGTAEGALVRHKRFLAAESYRPRYLEEPHQAAEDLWVEALAGDLRAFACKGGATKLAKEIAKVTAPH